MDVAQHIPIPHSSYPPDPLILSSCHFPENLYINSTAIVVYYVPLVSYFHLNAATTLIYRVTRSAEKRIAILGSLRCDYLIIAIKKTAFFCFGYSALVAKVSLLTSIQIINVRTITTDSYSSYQVTSYTTSDSQ